MKKIVSGLMLIMLLIGMLTLPFYVQPIKADPATIIVPDDYPTIQEAINHASEGDTIYVHRGYYAEEVVVDKSVSLIGVYGPALLSFKVVANNVYIGGFRLQNPGFFPYGPAIVLDGVNGCIVFGVIVSGVDEGPGIVLEDASNNIIANCRVWGLPWGGCIMLVGSSNNTIFSNTIDASYGPCIYLENSSDNNIFHNNFYGYYAIEGISINVWNDGYPSGGNYWSDYVGVDLFRGPYQNETGSDGIGDTPYVIDADNRDRYPFMNPWSPLAYDVAVTDVTCSKTVVGQGYSVSINVLVANSGDYPETFDVTLYVSNWNETRTVYLPNGTSTILTFACNTTGFVKGNYTVWAYVWPVPGEVEVEDNIYIDGIVTVTIPGDVDGDFDVDILDVVKITSIYATKLGDPRFNPNSDIDNDGKITIFDVVICTSHYGKKRPITTNPYFSKSLIF